MEYERLNKPLLKREKDITNEKFNMLTALYPTIEYYGRSRIWCFKCDCGKEVFLDKHTVVRGNTKSCGCLGQKTRLLNCHDNRTCCVEGTNLGNLINQTVKKNNTSGYTGVTYHKQAHKWVAQIMFQRKWYYLGCYMTIEEAVAARKIAEKVLFQPVIERNFNNLSEHLRTDYVKQLLKEALGNERNQ